MKGPAFIGALVLFASTTATAHADDRARDRARFERLQIEFAQRVLTEAGKIVRAFPPPSFPPAAPPSAPAPGRAPGPASDDPMVPLPVPGFGDAVVSVPRGARGPKPVMVVAHGNRDDPGGHCGYWREKVGDRGFILCPRGVARADGQGFTHGKELASEIDAGLAALRGRYGFLVDPGPMIYAGYSQGAYLGSAVVMRSPARFSRVVLIEGNGGWNEQAFAKGGGQRVLFACGQASCLKGAEPIVARFERANVASKVVYSPGAGHTLGGEVEKSVKAEWSWLVAGDPRWSS
jgi:predicted esterase